MAQGSYLLSAVWNAKTVGLAAAAQLNKLIDIGLPLEKLHIIGFSLGCQVADLCSHWRSWQYYAESVRNPEAFPASPALSYPHFQMSQNHAQGMVYMGYGCNKK
ncbi:hypothetical protein HF086_003653 [Spodoptera exigua]|uniref:Lipase domain-containing protein n=1 Tax=Spodoptera exigua TaxID=7107 RepID=A0A922S8Z7_SPOEX|nr:hypothetical protein HF086_003653 [Spodoptera exigua]